MGIIVAAIVSCAAFCTARMYEGGFDSKDKKSCFCYEKLDTDTPAAIENFTLQVKNDRSSPYTGDYNER